MASLIYQQGDQKFQAPDPLITSIIQQYTDKDIVRVEPLPNAGQKNAGMYKLCKSEYFDKLKELLQHKLLELQQKLGEEQENIASFYAEFNKKYTTGRINMIRLIIEASALVVAGKATLTELEGLLALNSKFSQMSRFHQRLENKKSLDQLSTELAQRPAEQVTQDYIDTLYLQLKPLTNITTINPRIAVDISYSKLEKEALAASCSYILKLDTDEEKIKKEISIQKIVNGINANITPIVFDENIKTFGNGGNNLYGFAMELIHGRPFCQGCQDGQSISFSVDQNQYKGFSRENTDQLISIIQQLHANDIVHNDLNLENIIISPSGEVKIIDWGESKISATDEDKLAEIFDESSGSGLYTRVCNLLKRATHKDAKPMGGRDYTPTLKYLLNELYDKLGGNSAGIEKCKALYSVSDGDTNGNKKVGGKRKTKRRRKRNKKRNKTRRGKKRNTKHKKKHRYSRRTKRRRKK
jgi:serine/threonine protein kinase